MFDAYDVAEGWLWMFAVWYRGAWDEPDDVVGHTTFVSIPVFGKCHSGGLCPFVNAGDPLASDVIV
jgi:hypothetical protein